MRWKEQNVHLKLILFLVMQHFDCLVQVFFYAAFHLCMPSHLHYTFPFLILHILHISAGELHAQIYPD